MFPGVFDTEAPSHGVSTLRFPLGWFMDLDSVLPDLWHSVVPSAPPPTDSAPLHQSDQQQQDAPAVPPALPPGTHTHRHTINTYLIIKLIFIVSRHF